GRAIEQLSRGKRLNEVGNTVVNYIQKNAIKPYVNDNFIEGHIIFIDHFENIILNITREEFNAHRKGRSFKIVFKRDKVIDKISEQYSDVREGEMLALFNSAGYLEIAINKGNAAGLFGLQGFLEQSQNQQNRLFYQTARIFFE
ncbi:MAG: S-adenosyl-l-methionine hydroxide adenosyltransferase family protein, partial [Chitinophagaceae bacterium]